VTVSSSKIFLGTPHRGSSKTEFAHVVSNVAKAVLQKPNDKLIHVLAESSDVLERQRRSFASISKDITLVCISEELPTHIGMVSS